MAKGNIAKEQLINKIIDALSSDYLGTEDGKKFYFKSKENGEDVQVCITMTCPKTGITIVNQNDWSEPTATATSTPSVAPAAEISDEDKAKVAELMAKLGL